MDFTVPVRIGNSCFMLRYPEEEIRFAAIAGPYTFWATLTFELNFDNKTFDLEIYDALFSIRSMTTRKRMGGNVD